MVGGSAWTPRVASCALVLSALATSALVGCGEVSSAGFASAAPGEGGTSARPPGDAPTGQRWEAVESEQGCGRSGVKYVLVDEVCGADGQGYDDVVLTAPMFRDGALVGSTLYTVDATFMWALDVSDATRIRRRSLLGGIGQPVAAAPYTLGAKPQVLLAAGEEGLLRIDVSNPAAPAAAARVELPGFAHDVHVVGSKAYLALGKAGIAEVDLVSGVTTRRAVSGYAAGITVRGTHAYVAACSSLQILDLATGRVIGRTATTAGSRTGALEAPAKDVELVGDVAFVAAGRHGAVAIDVSSPSSPRVLGNCTRPEPSFYASGVRAQADKLYVAGGEWGVLPLDVHTPAAACTSVAVEAPAAPAAPSTSAGGTITCSAEAPWEVMAWEELWAPPPPRKDPIQVLPAGPHLYAFGDARRIGTRAVDVRATATSNLTLTGRYDEPLALADIAATPSRVVAAGARGGLFAVGIDGALTRVPSDAAPALRNAKRVVFLDDGRWVAGAGDQLSVEGQSEPVHLWAGADVHGLAAMNGDSVAVATATGVGVIGTAPSGGFLRPTTPKSRLPLAVAAAGDTVYAAAPEWTESVRIPARATVAEKLPPHGVFDATDMLDTAQWRIRLPRHLLLTTPYGLAEIAGVGSHAGLTLHAATRQQLALAPATYAAAASDGTRVFLLGIDRGSYRTTLVTIALTAGVPELVGTEVFTGVGVGIAVAGGRAYVADADGAIRVYRLDGRQPVLTSVTALEPTP